MDISESIKVYCHRLVLLRLDLKLVKRARKTP